ncbi:MAG: O-antigen ligase family protein, partial [Candidatus Latescibacterota bacterium]
MHANSDTGLTHRQTVTLLVISALLVAVAPLAKTVIPLGLVKLALFGVAAAVMGFLAFCYPKQGLYFTIFYIYAGLSFYAPYPVAAPLVVLIAASVLLRILRGDEEPINNWFFSASICVLTVIVIQSMVYAWYPAQALLALTVYAKVLVVVLLCLQLIRTPRDLERLAMVMLAGVVATVLLGVVNIKMGWEKDATAISAILDVNRFAGTHVNPNKGALYMGAGIPLAVYAIRRSRLLIYRFMFGMVAVGLVVAIVMSFSRQAFFPLGFVLFAVFFKEARNKWGYLTGIVVVLVTLWVIPPYYWYRLRSVSDMMQGMSEDWSFFLRLQAHKTAWHLFVDAPFTGVGLNNFQLRSATELIARIPTHNAYLDILVWLGIFGFAAYLAVLLSGVRGFIVAMKARWDPELDWLPHLCYYFLISFLTVLTGAVFQSVSLYYLVWIPVAAGVIAQRLA